MIIPSKSSPSLLQFDVTDQVATITFDSPSKRNALEPAMRDELALALQHIQHDKSIRAVVKDGVLYLPSEIHPHFGIRPPAEAPELLHPHID